MSDTYTTPEGFPLYRPLMMPDAREFGEVLTAERAWDFETMNHRSGKRGPETPDEITVHGSPASLAYPDRIVSRFCSVRNMPAGRGHMLVTPTEATLDVLRGDEFQFFDRVGFEAIYHASTDRVLIVAGASGLIASRWLAYVRLDSVPVF